MILSLGDGWLGPAGAVRYGEAAHPGPPRPHDNDCSDDGWETHGCVRFRRPHRSGFHHALMDLNIDGGGPDDDARDEFTLIVDSCNATSWTGAKRFLRRTEADLVLLQEHHLPPERVAEASAWALRHRWHSLILPAAEGIGGGWRGGVAILARPHAGLSVPMVGPAEIVPARVIAASVEPPGFRPCTVICAYLEDGVGVGAANLRHLGSIGRCIRAQGEHVPCIAGGDWQAAPATVAATGFATQAGMSLVATGHPRGTYRSARSSTELDYFFLSNDLALAVNSIETVEGAGVKPHVPVRIAFLPRVASTRALHVRCPPPLPTQRMTGPLREPPEWGDLRRRARNLAARAADKNDKCGEDFAAEYASVYSDWADRAEREIIEATGAAYYGDPKKLGLRGKAPVLKWRSIVSEKPAARRTEADQTAWRDISAKAVEVQRALHHLVAASPTLVDHDVEEHSVMDDGDVHDDPDPSLATHIDDAMDLLDYVAVELDGFAAEGSISIAVARLRDLIVAAGLVADGARNALQANHSYELARAADQVGNLLELIKGIRDDINQEVARAAADDKAAEVDEWKRWIAANIDSGAKNAHRFLALPEEWQPTVMTTADGVHTSSPPKLLEAYRRKYDGLWNGRATPAAARVDTSQSRDVPPTDDGSWKPWHDVPERVAFPRATPAEFRAASMTFKEATLVAYDGVAMRHYALLSDGSLEVLADIVLVIEYLGHLPRQLRFAVMPLIAKARGGHRGIASLVGLYRLWARLRREATRAWEAANDRPYFAAGKGRGPQDAVWRQAARAEAAVSTRRQAATVLWDLSSFFETVRRVPLWHRARRLGFPLVLLRVALNAYAAPRALSMNGALARPLVADDGVLAGCGLAMTLTKIFVIESLDRVMVLLRPQPALPPPARDGDEVPDAIVDMYVDDIAATAEGTIAEVITKLSRAVEVLHHEIVDVLGCSIEAGKAAVVASSAALAARLKRQFGDLAGPSRVPDTSAANLGVDFAPGRPRTAHAASGRRRRRMHRLARKAARLARIRSIAGRRAKQIFITGPLAEATYGAAVNGLSGVEVQALRRAAACALTPRARGRSLSAVILLAGAPTWKGEVETVLQYARQVWTATVLGSTPPQSGEMTLPQLSKIWHAVDAGGLVPPPGSRAWSRVRGPIGALHLTLRRIGWSMRDPFTVTDHDGVEVQLTRVPPALLAQLLRRAVVRTLEEKVGSNIAAGDPRFSGRRAATDHVVAQLASDRRLTPADRAAYRSVACGALMTFSRAARCGYLVPDRCPLCGQDGDTVHHRIWRCQHPDAVAARSAAAPEWLRKEAERSDPCDSFWTHGFVPHPGDVWPKPAANPDAHVQYGDEGNGEPADGDGTATAPILRGNLAGDGSCSTHVFPELRRAGTAIVQRREDGARGWSVQCPVPSPLPQTPQAAEFAVLALAAQFRHATAKTCIASDCANVVAAFNGPAASAISPKRPYAGIMRQVLGEVDWRRRTVVRKVKAHVDPHTVTDADDKIDAIENGAADKAAKEAAKLHPQPSPAQVSELEAALKRSRLIVRAVAKVVQVFPPMPTERMLRPPPAREGARFQRDDSHDWYYTSGMWRCRVCMRMTLQTELSPALACQRCEGPKASLAAEAIVGRGHVLAKTQGPTQVLFCIQCGAFSARRAYGLGVQCPGVPKPSGRQALARIRRGLQPWESREAGGRTRGLLGSALAWDEARRTFVACGPAPPPPRRLIPPAATRGGEAGDSDPASSGGQSRPLALEPSPSEPVAKVPRRVDGGGPGNANSPLTATEETTAAAPPWDAARGTKEGAHVGVLARGDETADGGDLTARPVRERRPPEHDALPVHGGCHRLDSAHGLGGSTRRCAQRRPRPESLDRPCESSVPLAPRSGRPSAGSTPRVGTEYPLDDASPPNDDQRGSQFSCGDNSTRSSPAGSPGGERAAAPPPRVRRRAERLAPPRPPGDVDEGRRDALRPRDALRRPTGASTSGTADADRSAAPWLWQPPWLYLPHLGAGDGSELVSAIRDAKRRRLTDGEAAPEEPAPWCRARQVAMYHGPDPHGEGARIHGRGDDTPGPRGDGPGLINGLGNQLGATVGHARLSAIAEGTDDTTRPCGGAVRDGAQVHDHRALAQVRLDSGRAREQALLDARLSTMTISLQQHADRVAVKRARDGPVVGPTASSRLDALRRRVAARAAHAVTAEDGGTAGGNSDVDDAAARAAHHAVPAAPADWVRQLRD